MCAMFVDIGLSEMFTVVIIITSSFKVYNSDIRNDMQVGILLSMYLHNSLSVCICVCMCLYMCFLCVVFCNTTNIRFHFN